MRQNVLLLVSFVFFCFGNQLFAQDNLKLGHIDTQKLLEAMPESDSARAQIQKNAKDLEETMEEMQVELNNKYENYINNMDSYSDLIRQTKETELQDLQQRIQQFQATAEQDIQRLRQELFQPIIEKANKAIADVAKEKGFNYVFDTSLGSVVYFSEDTENLMEEVKARLGIQ